MNTLARNTKDFFCDASIQNKQTQTNEENKTKEAMSGGDSGFAPARHFDYTTGPGSRAAFEEERQKVVLYSVAHAHSPPVTDGHDPALRIIGCFPSAAAAQAHAKTIMRSTRRTRTRSSPPFSSETTSRRVSQRRNSNSIKKISATAPTTPTPPKRQRRWRRR